MLTAPRSIWSPGFIGSVCLKNRIIRSAVNDAQADAYGGCTLPQISLCRDLAGGGVGAIISGHMYVHRSGMAGNRQLGIDKDALIPGLSELVRAAHDTGGILFAQLSHAGSQADIYLTGQAPTGPSTRISPEGPISCAMGLDDIATIIEAFALAANRAQRAGFDGIQIHAAHGYCLSEFLSPAFNKRSDAYGGSVEKRAQMLLEVCRAVRETVGRDYPVTVKINSEDFRENGMTRPMMRESIKILTRENLIDAVEISGLWGKYRAEQNSVDAANPGTEAYAYNAAVEFKQELDLPLILVGGIRSLHVAKALIERDHVDFIAMARPLIRDTNLLSRWWQQDHPRAKAPC